jgi:hypothetical protein
LRSFDVLFRTQLNWPYKINNLPQITSFPKFGLKLAYARVERSEIVCQGGNMKNDYQKPAVTATLTEQEVFGAEDLMASAWSRAWSRTWNNHAEELQPAAF